MDAHISTTYMNAIERGTKNPTVDVLERLALALDVEIVDFFAMPLPGENPRVLYPVDSSKRGAIDRK